MIEIMLKKIKIGEYKECEEGCEEYENLSLFVPFIIFFVPLKFYNFSWSI